MQCDRRRDLVEECARTEAERTGRRKVQQAEMERNNDQQRHGQIVRPRSRGTMQRRLARMGVWKSDMVVGCGLAGKRGGGHKRGCGEGKSVPYPRAFVNHRGRQRYPRPRGQAPELGASQVPEPERAEFVRSVVSLVSECGAMIWSRSVHRRRQK